MPCFIEGNSRRKAGNHDSSLTYAEVRAIAFGTVGIVMPHAFHEYTA